MALRRLTKRPSDGLRGWGRNGGKARRRKRRDPSLWVRAAGVRAFIIPKPFLSGERGGKQNRSEGKGGRKLEAR